MSKAVYDVLLKSFLNGKTSGGVHELAAKSLAVDYLREGFKSLDSVVGRNGVIYVGKVSGPKGTVWACFLPVSEKLRKATGNLYRIALDQPVPVSGTLNTCPSNLTWGEEDVCYACIAK